MCPNQKIWAGIKRQRSILIARKIQAEITRELQNSHKNSHKILKDVVPDPVIFCNHNHAEFEQKNQTYANFDALLMITGSRGLVTNQSK